MNINLTRQQLAILGGLLLAGYLVFCCFGYTLGRGTAPEQAPPKNPAVADVPQGATKPPDTPTPAPTNTSPPAPTNTPVPVPTNTPTPVPVPTYHVATIEEQYSMAGVKQKWVRAVTEFPISVKQVNGLCKKVRDDLKPVNEVVVFVYDTRSIVGGAFSIAKCEYAGNRWAYEYRPKLKDPQAALSQRPTQQEYNMCQQWDELSLELWSESGDIDASDTIAYEQVAKQNGVSVQTVQDTILKCMLWEFR